MYAVLEPSWLNLPHLPMLGPIPPPVTIWVVRHRKSLRSPSKTCTWRCTTNFAQDPANAIWPCVPKIIGQGRRVIRWHLVLIVTDLCDVCVCAFSWSCVIQKFWPSLAATNYMYRPTALRLVQTVFLGYNQWSLQTVKCHDRISSALLNLPRAHCALCAAATAWHEYCSYPRMRLQSLFP